MSRSIAILTALAILAVGAIAYQGPAVGHGPERKRTEPAQEHHMGGHGMPRNLKEMRNA